MTFIIAEADVRSLGPVEVKLILSLAYYSTTSTPFITGTLVEAASGPHHIYCSLGA